ncbi:MAG: restriction endonuclease subunit S [Acidimicrobiia bacterium]|nr:restriction endonuclease subunit S [Acidimicrobiia bacterium]
MAQVGHVCDTVLGKMLQTTQKNPGDQEVPYLRAGLLDTLSELSDLPTMFAQDSEVQALELREGDLLVAEGGDVGRSEVTPRLPHRTIFQNSLHRIRLRARGDIRFVRYALSSIYSSGWLDVLCNRATFGHLTVEKLRQLRIPWPQPSVQAAIADFLDTETSRIDTLITKKRRMIELLEERLRLTALGLLTGEGQGPSWRPGPYWLGSVPRAWTPRKIAWEKRTASGTTPTAGNPIYYNDSTGVPWITTSELRETRIVDSDKRVTNAAFEDYSALKVFPAGTILVAMYGATVGRLGILGIPAATNQACCAVYGSGTLDQQFLYWWLWANRGPLVSMAYGSGQPNISQELIRGLRIPAPDLEEQRRIADNIEREFAGTERATSELNRLIELLAERRQALITTAVTGELPIPGMAAYGQQVRV